MQVQVKVPKPIVRAPVKNPRVVFAFAGQDMLYVELGRALFATPFASTRLDEFAQASRRGASYITLALPAGRWRACRARVAVRIVPSRPILRKVLRIVELAP